MAEKEVRPLFTVVKVDLDIHPPLDWFNYWVSSRKALIDWFGLKCEQVNFHCTLHGIHFWFHFTPGITFDRLEQLQFLLGDDHRRVYFTLQRRGFKRLKHKFNILFNKKWWLD